MSFPTLAEKSDKYFEKVGGNNNASILAILMNQPSLWKFQVSSLFFKFGFFFPSLVSNREKESLRIDAMQSSRNEVGKRLVGKIQKLTFLSLSLRNPELVYTEENALSPNTAKK